MSKIELLNLDCMLYMAGLKDKEFDLAIVDPEFGIGIGNSPRLVTDKGLEAKSWDDKPIDPAYFVELFRVSKNQIIWGGNYYELPATKHCIIWDKMQPEKLSFGMFDYAWTSFSGANKLFRRSVQEEQDKIHPTQKPVKLYKWLLHNYAKPVCNNKHTEEYKSLCTDCNKPFRILDTHLGSGSSAIAAHSMGFDFVGCELDKGYYDAACKRFKEQTMQQKLFI